MIFKITLWNKQFIDSIKLYVDELLKNKDNKDEKDKKKKIEQNNLYMIIFRIADQDHSTIIKLLKKLKTFKFNRKPVENILYII